MIVLVEGVSDKVALEVTAHRLGVDPPKILAIGGAHAARRVRADLHERAPGQTVVGMVDIADRWAFERALDVVEACDRDLEDELIRAVGVEGVLRVIEAEGELASFQRLQRQPAQRGRSPEDQLRRYFGGRSGNKERYAALLAAAVEPGRIPQPFLRVLGMPAR